jgi:DNA-3-methyladenine glycosylase II
MMVEGLEARPTPTQLAALGERWAPYRSYASFYLWRIADSAAVAKVSTKRSQD